MNNIPLSKISKDECGIIRNIYCDETLKTRLFDLGLIEGTKIKCVNIAMGKSPLAFDIRGTIVALRKSDCQKIFAELI